MVPKNSDSGSGQLRLSRLSAGTALGILCALLPSGRGQVPADLPLGETVLTNFSGVWSIPREQRHLPHRLQTEVVIYYFDAEWNSVWGECQGKPAFLPLGDGPTPLKPGQRVAVDGVLMPLEERMVWEKTRLRVLEEGVKREPKAVPSLANSPAEFKACLVEVEGLIDSMRAAATHARMNFLADGAVASAYVLRDQSGVAPRFKPGDFVRMKCVYAPQLDQDGRLGNLDLWVARLEDIEVVGSLETDPRFTRPITLIEEIHEDSSTNELLCVAGVVRKHEPGISVTLWDRTGQVTLQSKQTQPLRLGDRIEAIGYPSARGVQQRLNNSLYRLPPFPDRPAAAVRDDAPDQNPLRLAEQIRDLSREDAALHRRVKLRAAVAWSNPEKPFAFVMDASGCIRVVNPVWDAVESTKPGTIVLVEGETAAGDFVPVVTNAVLRRVGWWNLSAEIGPAVTLEQALAGAEEGRWGEMHGFVREVSQMGGLRRIEMTTPSGEFEAWVPSSRSLEELEGSIVRAQGVCTATANSRHQLTGIQIWIPESRFILVEEARREDVFDTPLRPLETLRRFNPESALNRRLRTSGTVIMHLPGRYLYIQEANDAVFALSRQKEPLRAGDQVEVVGFAGNEGRRFLLREAVYRRTGAGQAPRAVQLPPVQSVDLDLEGRLAQAEGILLNAREKDGEVRLLFHTRDSAFEAVLDATRADGTQSMNAFELGSRLAVTGVYEVQSDEYGKPSAFQLRLRSPDDLSLVQRPPWWTLSRLLWVLLGVLGVSVAALTLVFLIAHKNRLLRQAQAALQTANDRLEQRVLERTRELRDEVSAKERARADLAEAQEHLVLTSHRAGMAEVATGVLHNVGNVLNSVNVSASVLSERLRCFSSESVVKTAELFKKHQDDLAGFLTHDPRGKVLPGYLEKLGAVLTQDKREIQSEIASLAKNIDHIKTIVSMQQSYARVGGAVEELDPKDLVEDALQINSASYGRNAIHITRDYQPTPRVTVDRHKVLQILVNLVSNARHALNENNGNKEVTLTVASAGPDRIRISVRDNGVGIAPDHLKRIFSQGFTTRKDGHGFGLHSGAIAARELGGSLNVRSDGQGCGATFTLEMPVTDTGGRAPVPVDAIARQSVERAG